MKSLKISAFGLVLAVVLACEPEADLFKTFIIQKGEHYANPRVVQTLQSSTLNFDAKFDQSAMYIFDEEGFQNSKNKLLGFSDCNSLHHENSARFAWQWYNNQPEIWAYCYVNGSRVEKFIGVAALNKVESYSLSIKGDDYVFQFADNPPVRIERGNVCARGVYYMLWPYFGGSLPAPHTVKIEVKINF
jgi:hypothetical protein